MKDLNPLFSAVIDEWYSDHKLRILESTAYNYRVQIPFIKSYFEGVRIQDVNAEMIYRYIQHLRSKYVVLTSVRVNCKIIKMSTKFAVKKGYIYYDPSADVSMPRRSRAEIFPFTEQEINLILSQNYISWVYNGVVIAYHTGMRLGEIYALRWSDINFDEGFISVQRAQSRACSCVILKTTKTANGIRRVDIDSHLINFLRSIQINSDANNPYVFPGGISAKYPFRVPYNISDHLKQMCVNVGVPPRNFHNLRHTHATILLAHGVHPKIVQERLGHSSITITMEVYSHTSPTIQQQAVSVYENLGL